MTETPNPYALQRVAPCAPAAFPPTMHVSRRTPQSLILGSLGQSHGVRSLHYCAGDVIKVKAASPDADGVCVIGGGVESGSGMICGQERATYNAS